MKSKILLFLTLITYTFTKDAAAVTLSSVETGACKDKKYTFVIKANADGDLKAGSATVTLSSPASTTPTCTFEAVTIPAAQGRRLADGDFDITCVITSKLENAEIKVNAVAIGSITATLKSGTFPLSMTGTATCEGTTTTTTTTTTTNTDSNTTDAGKFIQISAFLFLFILTVF